MSSSIVPFYSASPPPLDDTELSVDNDDDEFGDFSSAPTAVDKNLVDATDLKINKSVNNSCFFRPISPNHKLQQDFQFTEGHADDDTKDNDDNPRSLAADYWQSPIIDANDIDAYSVEKNKSPREGNAVREIDVCSKIGIVPSELFIADCSKNSKNSELASPFETSTKNTNLADSFAQYACSDQCLVKDFVQNSYFQQEVTLQDKKHEEIIDKVQSDEQKEIEEVTDFDNPFVFQGQVLDSFNLEKNKKSQLDFPQDCKDKNITDISEGDFCLEEDFDEFPSGKELDEDMLVNTITERQNHGNIPTKLDDKGSPLTDMMGKLEYNSEYSEENNSARFNEVGEVINPVSSKSEGRILVTEKIEEVDDKSAFKILKAEATSSEQHYRQESDADKGNFNDFDEFHFVSNETVNQFSVNKFGSFPAAAGKSEVKDNEGIQLNILEKQTASANNANGTQECDSTKGERDDFDDFQFAQDVITNAASDNSNDEATVVTVKMEVHDKESKPRMLDDDSQGSQTLDTELNDLDDFEDFQCVTEGTVSPNETRSFTEAVTMVDTSDARSNNFGSVQSAFGDEPSSSNDESWASFNTSSLPSLPSHSDAQSLVIGNNEKDVITAVAKEKRDLPASTKAEISSGNTAQLKMENLISRIVANCYPQLEEMTSAPCASLADVTSQPLVLHSDSEDSLSRSAMFHETRGYTGVGEKSHLPDTSVWNNLKIMDLTSAFSFQWHTSSLSRNLLRSINIDTSSILIGHKKPQAPLFAPNLGLLEPMKASIEVSSADKDPRTVLTSDLTNSSLNAVPNSFTPQDVPQFEFDWGGSGLTNPLDATEKERELLDALEPAVNDSSLKTSSMSVETMLATLLPSIPSTQFIPKSQKDSQKKQLSEEALQILAKLPDLSFMHAKVLMFPLKDSITN